MCFPRHPDTQSLDQTAQAIGDSCPDAFMEVAPFPAPALDHGPKQHPQLAHATLLPRMEAWQQQQPQQPPQHPACFVPTGVASSSAGVNGLLACQQGWQPMVGQGLQSSQYLGVPAALQTEEELQQVALDDEGAAGGGMKGRLRWSAQLHAQFVAAVDQLGGAFTATPKRILAIMAVSGLTLFHVKSHLQKYRNALSGSGCGSGKRRCVGHARKRSAANMRALACGGAGSACGSGSSSDAEAEAEAEAGQQHPASSLHAGGSGSAGDTGSDAVRSCKRASPLPPPVLLSAQAALGGGGGGGADRTGSPFASDCLLLPGWGSEPDLDAIDEELAAALAPAGSLSDSEQLLDLQPASLEQLDRELSQELACCGLPRPPAAAAPPPVIGLSGSSASPSAEASPPPAAASAAAPAAAADGDSSGTATRAHSAGGDSAGGGQCTSICQQQRPSGTLPEAAAAAAAASPSAPALPAVPAVFAALPRPPSPAISSGEHGLLQAALKIQVEMQRQLSQTIESQQQLQRQLETHGKYIESLLRSEGGPLPSKPAAAARAGSKGRSSGGPASTRAGRVTAVAASAHQRSASLQASPFAPQVVQQPPTMDRSGSGPQLVEPTAAAGPLKPPPPQLSMPLLPADSGLSPAPLGPLLAPQLAVAPAQVQPVQRGQAGLPQQQEQAAAAAPRWQLEHRFRQQQDELERQIEQQRLELEQQRLELEQQAQQRRQLLEQQQQQEHAAAAAAAASTVPQAKQGGPSLLVGLLPGCDHGMGSSAPAPLLQTSNGADSSVVPPSMQPQLQQQQQPSCQPPRGWSSVTGSPALQSDGAVHLLPLPPVLHPAGSHASCATITCPAGAAAAGRRPNMSGSSQPPETARLAASTGSEGEHPSQGGAASAPPAEGRQQQRPPPQQPSQQPGLVPPLDSGLFDADMWDSLLMDTGVLQQLLDADS